LHAGWLTALRARRRATAAQSHIEKILAPLAPGAALVTVLDGHPASLAWLGGVAGQRVIPMGVDRFGQSADLPDIYQEYQLDTDAILDACAQALLSREPARNQ
jgi:pyruvate dehydrogenase E1 component